VWPGRTTAYKLGLNYSPGFLHQQFVRMGGGDDQILWLLGEDEKVTELRPMNFFVAANKEDGGA